MMHQTWSFLIILAITLNLGGPILQARAIFRKRSGEAVSVVWFTSSVGLEVVNVIYGWSHNDWLFIANALVCIVGQTLVLLALRTYKPFGRREQDVMTVIVAVITSALVLPYKAALQMTAQAINLYGGWDQPRELKKAHEGTGALSLIAILMAGTSSGIWAAYCWTFFGLLGPVAGYCGYAVYSAWMAWQWCKKARPAKSS